MKNSNANIAGLKNMLLWTIIFLPLLWVNPNTGRTQTPIRGYADIHNHQFSNLGFGQRVWVGEPFGPIDQALDWCTDAHGAGGVLDNADKIRAHRLGHLVGGYPQFDGWPRHDSHTHQTVYQDWLKRAHQGGLQIMVMLAVNNKGLCQLQGPKDLNYNLCEDMQALEDQLAGAKAMEQYIAQTDGGWYKIVYTPREARQAISEGKLAVILGVEMDFLFGCEEGSACSEAYIDEQLDLLYEKGIRQITPVHLYDNAFGGAALYSDANSIIAPDFFPPDTRSQEGYDWALNEKGMTDLGKFFMKKIMDKGMLLDIDHMSVRTKESIFSIAKQYQYPLIASHAGFVNQHSEGNIKRHELNLSDTEITEINNSGGMVAPILLLHENISPTTPYSGEEDCKRSAEAFVDAYRYALARMGANQIAFGSDFNGGAGLPGPRYGPDGCYSNNTSMVAYPFTSKVNGVQFDRCQSGDRSFDINVDGLAHIGLLPDFIEELSRIGLTDSELEPLFNSAEGYVQVWEKARAASLDHRAMAFDAQSEVATPGHLSQGLTEMTIEAWIKNESAGENIQAIVSSANLDFVHLQASNDANVNCVVYVNNGEVYLPAVPKSEGQWQHVALVVMPGDSRLYINGLPYGNVNLKTFSSIKPTANILIGKGYNAGRVFNGGIANVRIWDRARNQDEIGIAMHRFGLDNQPGLLYQSPVCDPQTITSSGECIAVPETATSGTIQSLTVEAWINNGAVQNGIQAIVSATGPEFVHLQMSGDANVNNAVYLADGGTLMLPVIPVLSPGWHHVALVAASGNSRVYVDGQQIGATNTTTFTGIKPSSSVFIGKGWHGGRVFNGKIADVRIWKNRVLTQEQVNTYRFTPPALNAEGLVFLFQ